MNYSKRALDQVRERRFLIDRVDGWIYDEIAPYLGQRILEVGCGLGNLIRHLVGRELVVGIDPDPACIEDLRRRYDGVPSVQVYATDICAPEVLQLGVHAFDTVVSLNVLEHIEDDLLALRHMRELLCPGGHLVLIVPAHSWLYGSMDRSIGHYRRYDKAAMAEKLVSAGFALVSQKYLNSLGALGWWINGRLLGQTVPPSGQLQVFNKLVPIVRVVERAIRPPIGISLFTVAA